MTITAQGVRAVYEGSGSTGPFPLQNADAQAILFADDSEIVVTRYSTLGVPTVLTINTHYTLTGEGQPTAGAVTLLSALAIGETLVIQRVTPRTQLIDLIAGGKLSMAILEGALDKLIRIDQEDAEAGDRAVRLPITWDDDTFDFPVPSEGAYIGWNNDADGLENKTAPTVFRSGSGVPDNDVGINGDFYLNTANGDLYGPKAFSDWGDPLSLVGPPGDEGDQGPTGAAGTSILNGSGAPDNGLGNDGDFYLNTANYNIHGPKAGVWPSGVSLVGPAGDGSGDVTGPAGATDGNVAVFQGSTGKAIDDSGVLLTDLLTTAAAAAAYQPLDADLTAIAALTTAAFGRSVLETANAGAAATLLGLGTGDSPQFTAVNIGAASDTTLARSAAGILTVEGTPLMKAGRYTIPVMAGAMSARATSGAGTGTFGVGLPTIDFDATSQEYAVFAIPMPKSWDEGTVTFQPIWTNASGLSTQNVVFSLSGAALSNDDAGASPSQGTPQTSNDTWLAQNDIHFGPESAAITIGGSPAEGDLIVFEISRVVASDNLTGDAKLIGINLFINTNAASDA